MLAALKRIYWDKAHGLGRLHVDQHRPGGFAREQGQGAQLIQWEANPDHGIARKALLLLYAIQSKLLQYLPEIK